MDKRNVQIDLNTAKEWYNGDDESLKEIALQAFSEDELFEPHWIKIKTFEDAYDYLYNHNLYTELLDEFDCAQGDSYTELICEYRIIVAALTNNKKRYIDKEIYYYPVVQFCKSGCEKNCYGDQIIGTIKSNEKEWSVISGRVDNGGTFGPLCLYSDGSLSYSWFPVGFLAVESIDIANHISKYFGKLVFDIKAGGMNMDYEWIKVN